MVTSMFQSTTGATCLNSHLYNIYYKTAYWLQVYRMFPSIYFFPNSVLNKDFITTSEKKTVFYLIDFT